MMNYGNIQNLNPVSDVPFAADQILDRIYSNEGVYRTLHDLAFSLGSTSLQGKLSSFTDELPAAPREAVTIAAKADGGVVVSRNQVTVGGQNIVNRYRLIIPSDSTTACCDFVSFDGYNRQTSSVARRRLSPLPDGREATFMSGVDMALMDVAMLPGVEQATIEVITFSSQELI
jgi:hypothetical protein